MKNIWKFLLIVIGLIITLLGVVYLSPDLGLNIATRGEYVKFNDPQFALINYMSLPLAVLMITLGLLTMTAGFNFKAK